MGTRKNREVYPLIPPQEMINFMHTHALHKQVTQIPDAIIFDQEIDFAVLAQAVNVEIQRNDCMRIKFFRKNGKIHQIFQEKLEPLSIPVIAFDTEQAQKDYFDADARKPLKFMKGELYRIRFFRTPDARYGIYLCVHHLVMDNAACFVFFNDLMAVYDHLKFGKPMPKPLGKYEDKIKKELAYYADGSVRKKLKQEYTEYLMKTGEPLYLGVEGMRSLEKARKLFHKPDLKAPPVYDILNDKAEYIKKRFTPELSAKADAFMEQRAVSGECLIQLGMRLHLAHLNGRHNETFFMVLCPRRCTRDEKRMGGNITCAMPWRVVIEEDDTFEEALQKLQKLQVWVFRHMDFPFCDYRDLEHELYHYSPITSAPSMMFSWMPVDKNSVNGYDYDYVGYDLGRYVFPLYTFSMHDAKSGCIRISYLHRVRTITNDDIDLLHNNTARVIEAGIENPNMTVGEIYAMLDGEKSKSYSV